MIIEFAQGKDKNKIAKFDRHIPSLQLGECIDKGCVYILKDDAVQNGGTNHCVNDPVVGVLRYSLFWQTIPFLDLLYIDEAYRGKGYGTQMMDKWERDTKASVIQRSVE